MSDDDQDSHDKPGPDDFTCDACRGAIPSGNECWSLKADAPMSCSEWGFCLCDACHSDGIGSCMAKNPSSTRWQEAPWAHHAGPANKFGLYASRLFRCNAHDDLSVHGKSCDSAGQGPYTSMYDPGVPMHLLSCKCRCAVCNRPGHRGCEQTWRVGTCRAFGDVKFQFMVCLECVPATKLADGKFAEQWFEPHLKRGVMRTTIDHNSPCGCEFQ